MSIQKRLPTPLMSPDFLGENVGVGKVVGVFEAFVLEERTSDAGYVACPPFLRRLMK
jgi:hypothetical protein